MKRRIIYMLILGMALAVILLIVIPYTDEAIAPGKYSLNYGQVYKVVWTETAYNSALQSNASELKIDQEFVDKAPEHIKALLALYGYNFSNECRWDGPPSDQRDNLKCSINTAVGVGYQCSDTQLALLEKYFPNEGISKNSCPTTPETATFQDILGEVIIIQTSESTFEVRYKHSPFNAREMVGTADDFETKPLISINEVDIFKFETGTFTKFR